MSVGALITVYIHVAATNDTTAATATYKLLHELPIPTRAVTE
jgi:hypothetical protein